jgi:hypothetical protein
LDRAIIGGRLWLNVGECVRIEIWVRPNRDCRKQNSVSSNERVLENSTPNVTTRDVFNNVLGGGTATFSVGLILSAKFSL